jgi:hypothetical protein
LPFCPKIGQVDANDTDQADSDGGSSIMKFLLELISIFHLESLNRERRCLNFKFMDKNSYLVKTGTTFAFLLDR